MSDEEITDEITQAESIAPASIKGRSFMTLLVVSGAGAGQWRLVPTQGGTLGRSPEADVTLGDPGVSREHAVIEIDEADGSYWIRDLGSTNGVFVAGRRVDRARIADGDQVQLSADTVVRVRMLDARETLVLHELQEAATTDSLTGLANRRYLLHRLTQELAYAKRHKVPLSVLMVDVQNLAAINEHVGHQAGEQALVGLTEVIEGCARVEDVVARYGGDELVVIARGYAADGSTKFAQRLCDAVIEAGIGAGGIQLRACVGIADYDPGRDEAGAAADAMELVGRADAAVYLARHSDQPVAQWGGAATVAGFSGDLRATLSAPVSTRTPFDKS